MLNAEPKTGTTWTATFIPLILETACRAPVCAATFGRKQYGVTAYISLMIRNQSIFYDATKKHDYGGGRCASIVRPYHGGAIANATGLPAEIKQRYLQCLSPSERRYVVISRDPVDVALSAAHHEIGTCDYKVRGRCSSFVAKRCRAMADWIMLRYEAHTGPLANESLVLDYDDVLQNPEVEFRRVALFFGLDLSPDEAEDVFLKSSPEVMREKNLQRNPKKGARVTRFAGHSSWRDRLPPSVVAVCANYSRAYVNRRYRST